jgi:hypothetical protein
VAVRSLVIPLAQEGPFRRVYETGESLDTNSEQLAKYRNLLSKLQRELGAPILLAPIRAAGSVAGILYAEAGRTEKPVPVEALKILAEFAGAQLDRLAALGKGVSEALEPAVSEAEIASVAAAGAEAAAIAAPPVNVGPSLEATIPTAADSTPLEAVAGHTAPAAEQTSPPAAGPPIAVEPPEIAGASAQPVAASDGTATLTEAEQGLHRDAKRFAKVLVSDIEIYNKDKVADGRKHKDLYARLKSDIDRGRQTFDRRFGKTLGKQYNYYHEELVRTLAANDPSLLGPEYPGPYA